MVVRDAVMANDAGEIDVHVGAKIRLRRKLLRLSQGKIAEALGITHHQVHKYEMGVNRVSASRIKLLAHILQVDPAYFFEDESSHTPLNELRCRNDLDAVRIFLSTKDGLEINRAFAAIRDVKTRRSIIELAVAISENQD